ncbi:MAG: hypothetical protein ACRDJE_11155 [Dehalococcoidia bacterium]
MTQHARNDPGTIPSTVWAKLRHFAGGLTPEEVEQLCVMKPEGGTAELSPSLQAKVKQGARELTPEEQVQVRLLVQHARTGTPAGEEADTDGYMIAQFNDGQGKKGRLQPVVGTSGGFDLDLQDFVNAVGFLAFTTELLEGPGGLAGPAPDPGQP